MQIEIEIPGIQFVAKTPSLAFPTLNSLDTDNILCLDKLYQHAKVSFLWWVDFWGVKTFPLFQNTLEFHVSVSSHSLNVREGTGTGNSKCRGRGSGLGRCGGGSFIRGTA